MPMQNSAQVSAPASKRRGYVVFRKFLLCLSYKQTLSGLDVRMFLPAKEDKATVFPKIAEALALILKFAPHRFAQIQRHVDRVWVFGIPPYLANWDNEIRTCILDRTYMRSKNLTAEALAATIIHETTHARIDSLGIPYSEELRERIERLCVMSELWFAKRLPDGSAVRESAEDQLRMPTAYWRQESFQERNLEALHELAKGNWVIRLLAKWTERRLEKRRKKSQPADLDSADGSTRK